MEGSVPSKPLKPENVAESSITLIVSSSSDDEPQPGLSPEKSKDDSVIILSPDKTVRHPVVMHVGSASFIIELAL